ncbi:MAG: hypothetical protein ACLP00_29245, partial [Terracidiphilus sp.]
VPNSLENSLAARTKKPRLAADEAFPGIEAEQWKDLFLKESGPCQAVQMLVPADPAHAGGQLRNRS